MPTTKRTIRRPGSAAPLKRQRSTGDGPSVAASAGPGTLGGRPLRAESVADARLVIRCTEGERAIYDDASGAAPASTWAREILLREAARILDDRDRLENLDVARVGDRRYRVSHGAWAVVVLVDLLPAGNGWAAEQRVELQEGAWPDEAVEERGVRMVLDAWSDEQRAAAT